MRGLIHPNKILTGGLVLLLALFVGACDTDSPTQPVQQNNPPPVNNPASATWNISVSANPDTFDIAEGSGVAQIQVTARRADNGQRVATGTTARLSTSAGNLSSTSGAAGTSIPIEFDAAGVARATLTTGTVTVPSTIVVRAQIESSFGSVNVNFVEVEQVPFQVTDVSPAIGPPAGGTPISIRGSGFVGPVRVVFTVLGQELPADNVRLSGSTRISATTPAINLPSGQNAPATVRVEIGFDANGNPIGTDSLANAFTYTRSSQGATTLKLISLTPTFGPNEGGTQVTINGEGFGNQVQVYFTNGPLVEATVLNVTPTRLEVITPSATGPNASNANSLVDVIVQDPVSGQSATLPGRFQYGRGGGGALFISSISPSTGVYLGGDIVTVFGQGFDEPVAVGMGGEGQSIISVTGTEIVVRTVAVDINNCSPQSGATSVTNIETGETASGGPVFTYLPIEPTITSVVPNSGPASGGNNVTINGIGFDPPIAVTINDIPAPQQAGTNLAAGILIVEAPFYTGSFPTQPCDLGGGVLGVISVPAFVDVEVVNLNTNCNFILQDGYAFTPPGNLGTTCRTTGGGGGGGGTLTAAFTVDTDDTNGALGPQEVLVTDASASSGTITSWSWDFGDGTTSNVQVPFGDGRYTYALPGFYDITLTVMDNQGLTDSVTITNVDVN